MSRCPAAAASCGRWWDVSSHDVIILLLSPYFNRKLVQIANIFRPFRLFAYRFSRCKRRRGGVFGGPGLKLGRIGDGSWRCLVPGSSCAVAGRAGAGAGIMRPGGVWGGLAGLCRAGLALGIYPITYYVSRSAVGGRPAGCLPVWVFFVLVVWRGFVSSSV